jgi:hypothetical protein
MGMAGLIGVPATTRIRALNISAVPVTPPAPRAVDVLPTDVVLMTVADVAALLLTAFASAPMMPGPSNVIPPVVVLVADNPQFTAFVSAAVALPADPEM